jgi:hypothetical protein
MKVQDQESSGRTNEEIERDPSPNRDAGEPMLYCPVCSQRLHSLKCKLICAQCGYYMSCADYY